MRLARLFNNLPTYLAFDDVETLTDAGAISATKAVTLIDMTGESGDVQFTLAAGTSVGQIKIIVRKDDGVSHNGDITVSNWTDGSVAAPQILLETGGAVICIALDRGFISLAPISVVEQVQQYRYIIKWAFERHIVDRLSTRLRVFLNISRWPIWQFLETFSNTSNWNHCLIIERWINSIRLEDVPLRQYGVEQNVSYSTQDADISKLIQEGCRTLQVGEYIYSLSLPVAKVKVINGLTLI